jgi:DNA-binding XRE family transcriptional regulator
VTLLQNAERYELKYGLGLPIGVRVVSICPIPKNIILPPITLGQHLKQHRGRLGLRQKDVAVILGVGQFTYMTWEKDQKTPFPRYYPNIIDWLGYDPLSEPESEGQRLRFERLRLGLTSQEMATRLGIDQGTLLKQERAVVAPLLPIA